MKDLLSVSWRHGLRYLVAGFFLVGGGFLLVGCGTDEQREPSQGQTNAEVVDAMLESMGGEEALLAIDTLTLKGNGTRSHFGQIPATGALDPRGNLTELTEVIDLANGQAAFNNNIEIGEGGFAQQRTEVLLYYKDKLMSWGTTNDRPNHVTSVDGIFSWASHNSPEFLLRRNAVTMALAARNADPDVIPMAAVIDGNLVWVVRTMRGEESVDLYISQNTNLLSGWHSLDTESMWGDTDAVYNLSDYREVDGVMLPHALRVTKADGVYLDLRYESIAVNDPAAMDWFEMPEEVVDQAEQVLATDGSWTQLNWNEVADNVYHIEAFSHHSMVVEFPDYVVVVEGPYTEGQSLTLVRQIRERLGKPVRSVVPTHPHYDHTGGIRGFVSVGANVLVAAGHEDELRMIVESPHSNPPDALARRLQEGAEVGQVEVFEEDTEISEEGMTLQLFEVNGIPHVEPMVLAYVPERGVLFQSDLFFGAPSPDATALHSAITQRGLEVEHIVGGHGGVLPFSSLQEVVGTVR